MKTTLIALNASYMHTSLALRQLMPTLSGFSVRPYEAHINLPHRQVLDDIARDHPDVAAFSCYIWNIRQVLRLVRALKRALPDVRIILGGPEVGHRAESVLSDHPEVDFVLRGEGERALAALLADIESGAAVRGVRTGDRLDPREWTDAYAGGIAGIENRLIYIETARGCPYSCQFCLSSAEDGVRALDAAESIRRLTALADGGAKLVKLVDRTFNFDRARANAIWTGLIEHDARQRSAAQPVGRELAPAATEGVTYHFEIGAHLIDDAAIAVLSRARPGLFQFEVGVQSSNAGVLGNVRRAAPFERVAEGARRVAALGTIHLHVDLIAGMPGDDLSKFGRSFDDAFALGAEQLQLGFLKLLHGSGLRRDAESLGIVFEQDAPYEVLRTQEMSYSDLSHLKDLEKALNWYHNSGLYRCTLRWLLRKRGAFALFDALARRMRAAGVFDVERGEKARAAALLEAFAGDDVLAALMRHDLLSAGRRRDLPQALAFSETEAQRALLRARFHPVRGQSCFVYGVDVEAYERDGALVYRETTVIYG